MDAFESAEKETIKNAADRFLQSLESGTPLPHGLGLKRLKPKIYEIRAGLETRIIFRRASDLLEWLFIGNHDEVRRFLKHF